MNLLELAESVGFNTQLDADKWAALDNALSSKPSISALEVTQAQEQIDELTNLLAGYSETLNSLPIKGMQPTLRVEYFLEQPHTGTWRFDLGCHLARSATKSELDDILAAIRTRVEDDPQYSSVRRKAAHLRVIKRTYVHTNGGLYFCYNAGAPITPDQLPLLLQGGDTDKVFQAFLELNGEA